MGTLANLLMGLAGPLVLRALTTLGLGLITFAGVTASLNSLIQQAQGSWAGVSPDVLAFASLAGVPQGLGIVCGAMTARVGMWVAAKSIQWVTSAT